MRLQKFMAQAGVASRRESEKLILGGHVTVNGKRAEIGMSVEGTEDILVHGKKVTGAEEKVYFMLNKPRGYVCTERKFEKEHNIYELLPSDQRLFSIGRLDKNTEGLVIVTNDGELANKLMHPKFEKEKEYWALVFIASLNEKEIDERLKKLETGVDIDGYKTKPAKVVEVKFTRDKTGRRYASFNIILKEGKNRQIRRMVEAVGLKVAALKRTRVGGVEMSGLEVGKYRPLKPGEVSKLT